MPTELGQLEKMTNIFYAYANQLTGSLPTELGSLTEARHPYKISKTNAELISTLEVQIAEADSKLEQLAN